MRMKVMTNQTALFWFRQDLRLADNPALIHAINNGYNIIPLYILDDKNAAEWKLGGAARWWLQQSLEALNETLGGNLVLRVGKADEIIPTLLGEAKIDAVFWNRCYEPWRIKRDEAIKAGLKDNGVACKTFNGSLLWEPWEVLKQDGTPYKVFTPYYRKGCVPLREPVLPLPEPEVVHYAAHNLKKGALDDLKLMPKIEWYHDMAAFWTPGEDGAKARMDDFLSVGLNGYNVSRLSPHLKHGEISPRQVWYAALEAKEKYGWSSYDLDHFHSELGWREFSYYLLYHFPQITWDNFQPKFDAFPWDESNSDALLAWQKGQTGIPIVDAGMRQLYKTGWMHNRVRMIVGSLLVKNLLIHWHKGEEWFWDTLVDADLASNSASWQWVAGSGADAAPYFRIFNPLTQGEKFDPNGDYVREFVPELKGMPKEFIHKPWEAGPLILQSAGVKLGQDYPEPIVDLKASRARALEAFQVTKQDA